MGLRTNLYGQKIIKEFEGLRLKAYKCSSSKWSIGYGATYYTNGDPVKEGDTINTETAEELFDFHVKKAESIVSSSIMVPVTSNEFSAMVSLAYNIRPTEFRRSSLIKALNAGEDREVAADGFLLFNISKGKKISGLIERRKKERQLFLTK